MMIFYVPHHKLCKYKHTLQCNALSSLCNPVLIFYTSFITPNKKSNKKSGRAERTKDGEFGMSSEKMHVIRILA